MSLSTHVLDVSSGHPAAGIAVTIEKRTAKGWELVARARTDGDGRIRELASTDLGEYRIGFATGPYFAAQAVRSFYPQVQVTFEITDASEHYHVPLLLSPFGYSTYRGS